MTAHIEITGYSGLMTKPTVVVQQPQQAQQQQQQTQPQGKTGRPALRLVR